MAGEVITGLVAKAYYDSDGAGVGYWEDLNIIGDVALSTSRNNSPVKERQSDLETTVLGQQVVEFSFRMTRRVGHEQYEALRDAYLNKTIIGLAFMSGDIETPGSEGWQGDFYVTDFPIDEPLEEASGMDVVVKPAADANQAVEYVIVEAP